MYSSRRGLGTDGKAASIEKAASGRDIMVKSRSRGIQE